MSVVIYNGIKMELVKTNGVERIPIFSSDKTTYLYTQWTHDFVAILNPAATAYDAAGVAAAGSLPIVTDKVLRHKLAQGHAVYEWYVGDANVVADRVIRSPAVGAKTDVNNGPHPEVVSIVQVTGTHTWMIHMRITTWINDCPQTPLILSHRWRQSSDIDSNHYSVRATIGEAVFNPVRLAELARNCDDFRFRLGHPIPDNFQRTVITVVQGEDGVTVNYSFIDTEKPLNVRDRRGVGITHVDVKRNVTWGNVEFLNAGTRILGAAALGDAARNIGMNAAGQMQNVVQARLQVGAAGGDAMAVRAAGRAAGAAGAFGLAAAAVGEVAGIAQRVVGAAISTLPKLSITIQVVVVGNRTSDRVGLLRAALHILVNRSDPIVNRISAEYSISVTFDETNRSVTINAVYSVSDLAAAGIAGAVFVNNIPNDPFFLPAGAALGIWSSRFNPDIATTPGAPIRTISEWILRRCVPPETPANIITPAVNVTDEPMVNPSPTRSQNTRGTWVEKLVSQSLSDPCAEPGDSPSLVVASDFGIIGQ